MVATNKPEVGSEIHSAPPQDIEADVRRTSIAGDIEKPADDAVPDQDAQLGVQKIEAITLSWSKLGLIALLVK